jgi:hypothetical protein
MCSQAEHTSADQLRPLFNAQALARIRLDRKLSRNIPQTRSNVEEDVIVLHAPDYFNQTRNRSWQQLTGILIGLSSLLANVKC